MNPQPIGVFDSGVGGLTVAAALARRLPGESLVYLGDTARLPYGTKSPATIERYTRANISFLERQGVKAVVIACNTASAAALPALLRDAAPPAMPVWGVIEPGAAAAVAVARHGVGVLATESTVESGAYAAAIAGRAPDLPVISVACPLFVPLVEAGWQEDPLAAAIAARYLEPVLAAGVDTLVLGCTHYPLLAPVIAAQAGPGVPLVDAAAALAEEVAGDLAARELTAPPGTPRRDRFLVTDAAPRFAETARRCLGREELELEVVDVG